MTLVPLKVRVLSQEVQNRLSQLPDNLMQQVVGPAVREGAKFLGERERSRAPVRTGTFKAAVGASFLRRYKGGLLAYVATGVRTGYSRALTYRRVAGRSKLSKTGKRLAKANSPLPNGAFAREVPTKIAHLVESGRGEVRPREKKALFDPVGGKFFGKRSRAVGGSHFLAQTSASAGGIAEATIVVAIERGVQAEFERG